MKLDVAAASLVGLGDKVTGKLENISIGLNTGLRLLDGNTAAIDFKQSFAKDGGYTIGTPGGGRLLNFTNEVLLAAAVGNAELSVDGYLSLGGAVSLTAGGTIYDAQADAGLLKAIPGVSGNGLTHDLSLVTLGGSNLHGFAGITSANGSKRTGVVVENVNFGMAIMVATSVAGITVPGISAVLPVYVAARANVGSARLEGTEEIGGARLEDVSIQINTSSIPLVKNALNAVLPGAYALASAVLPLPAVNFKGGNAFGGPVLQVSTGDPSKPVLLDFSSEVVAAEIGYFDVTLSGSVQLAGSMAFSKRGTEQVTLVDGRKVDVNSLAVSLADVRAFVGSGNYWGRNAATGRIDGTVKDDTAAGFVLNDLNLGGVYMLNMSLTDPSLYFGLQGSLSSAALVGINGLAANVSQFAIELNIAAGLNLSPVDFSKSSYMVRSSAGAINTLPGYAVAGPAGSAPIVLNYDQALLRSHGQASFNLLDKAKLSGVFDVYLHAGASSISFDTTLDLPAIEPLRATGELQFLPGLGGGLFGSLQAGAVGGASIINKPGFSLTGSTLVEINTTPVVRQVRSMVKPGEPDPNGDGLTMRDIEARTLRMAGTGQILAGGTTLDGTVSLVFVTGRIDTTLAGRANVGFGSLDVSGSGQILYGSGAGATFVIAGQIHGNAGRMTGVDGTVQINTGTADVTLSDGTVVPGNTNFDASIAAQIDTGLISLNVGARLLKTGELFEVQVVRGTADFFGDASLNATGFYRSNGMYLFALSGSTIFDSNSVTCTTNLSLSLGRDTTGTKTFRGEALANTQFNWGPLSRGDGPSFRGNLAFGPTSVSLALHVTILTRIIHPHMELFASCRV